MALSYPDILPGIFAAGATNHEEIPDTDADEGRMAWDVGFPAETSQPIASGGVPPRRLDMNGLGNRLSQHIMWQQSGGLYNWDASLDYPLGAHILRNGIEYIAIAANGPSTNNAIDPSTDVNFTRWKPFARSLVDIIYPIGSIYMSVNAVNPATLFGGIWQAIRGRFLLAAGGNYALGSTGGSASKQLSINEMPAHNHTVTIQNGGAGTYTQNTTQAGSHNHAISITAGAQQAGAHAHNVSVAAKTATGTTGSTSIAHSHTTTFPKTTFNNAAISAGAHTHNRGTMNITGSFGGAGLLDHRAINEKAQSGALYVENHENASFRDPNVEGGTSVEIAFDASRAWTGSTSSNGAHTHNVTIPKTAVDCGTAGGSHTHSISITCPGQTVTSTNAGAHTHNIVGNTQNIGNHTHGVTISIPAHTHSATVQNRGGSTSFSIMPPYLAVNVWQRTA